MTWLSPAYPVGAYSYSHGLEWVVVEAGKVRDAASLGDWIEDVLRHGAGRSDAILLAEAWRAQSGGDASQLEAAAELAAAFAPSAERRLETLAQGTAFLAATLAAWPTPELTRLAEGGREVAYPVAVGACAAAHALPLVETAQAFTQAFAANLVSAGVRLIPLGQSDGLRVLARLEPLIPHIVADALACTLDDLGGIAVMADVASMRHETQYTRLFRS
jgi:urease accessory protein